MKAAITPAACATASGRPRRQRNAGSRRSARARPARALAGRRLTGCDLERDACRRRLWQRGLSHAFECVERSRRIAAWTASREGHYSTTWWSSSVLLSPLIFHASHAAAASSRVHRNSVPSTQMRCIITANRRASATIAFFIPRRLAIFIAQALSHDHFAERNRRLWAAS